MTTSPKKLTPEERLRRYVQLKYGKLKVFLRRIKTSKRKPRPFRRFDSMSRDRITLYEWAMFFVIFIVLGVQIYYWIKLFQGD